MGNLDYWDRLKTPPKDALSKIIGGRLKGMTDINPQWRMKVMTDVFGPVGIGWKYTVDKLWMEQGGEAQICTFAMISLYIKHEGEWSEAIPGNGGSMFIANEKRGPHTSDEAYKMAVTDALSVAMKALGVGGDIYMGMSEGRTYEEPEPITDDQLIELNDVIKERDVDIKKLMAFAKVSALKEITQDSFKTIIAGVMAKPMKGEQ